VGNLMLIVFPTTLSPDYSYNQIPLVNFNSEQWKQLIFPTNDPPGMADVTPLLQQWGGLRLVEPVNMLLANGLAFLALAVVILLFVIAIIAYFRFKPTSFFLLLVFLAMLPTTNLLFVMGSIQAERFLYIPTMGFCVLIVLTVYGVVRKLTGGLNPHALAHNPQAVVSQPQADVPRALTGHHKPARVKAARFILIGICVLFAGRAWFRSAVWESDVTLWESAVTVCPNSFKTHKSLAYAWYEKSQNNLELLRKPQKRWGQERAEIDWIIDHARQAIWVTRESQIVFVHLGAYLRIKGDAIQMENAKFAGLPPEQRPANLDDPRPYYFNSAAVLAAAKPLDSDFNQRHRRYERGRGKTDDQIADIGNYEIYWNLGIAQMRLAALDQQRLAAIAQKEGAEQERQQLIAQITNELRAAIDGFWYMRHLAPGNIDAHLNMAMAYWQFGDLENAAVCFLSALLLDNNRQDALEALSRVYSQVPNQDPDPMRRPVVPAGVGLRLNIDSPLVRNHLQKAYVQLYQLFLDIRERNFARQIRDAALTQYKFPPEAFVALPPPPPVADPPKVPVQVAVFLVSALALVAALGFGWWGTTKSSAHQLPPV
jgi:tetratricopeptide (TPR) repeat protein